MKEFGFSFEKGLTGGLRQYDTNPRNNEALVEVHNLAPSELGLVPHEPIQGFTSTGPGPIVWPLATNCITLNIVNYLDTTVDIEGASVYVDGVFVGLTDANGLITIESIAVGGHTLRVVATGYEDSDVDDLLNDYFVVA